LARRQVAGTTGQYGEAIRQPGEQRLRGQGLQPRCRQFQRERQPVEPPANLDHGERILRREREVGANRLGALDQQVDGGHLGQGVQVE
jgi:hypothetical protein